MSIRIRCINKDNGNHDNPHEAIQYYGWVNESDQSTGKTDRLTMVKWLKSYNAAYVKDAAGKKVFCIVKTSKNGTEFLQTESDGRVTNNLLDLPECVG